MPATVVSTSKNVSLSIRACCAAVLVEQRGAVLQRLLMSSRNLLAYVTALQNTQSCNNFVM